MTWQTARRAGFTLFALGSGLAWAAAGPAADPPPAGQTAARPGLPAPVAPTAVPLPAPLVPAAGIAAPARPLPPAPLAPTDRLLKIKQEVQPPPVQPPPVQPPPVQPPPVAAPPIAPPPIGGTPGPVNPDQTGGATRGPETGGATSTLAVSQNQSAAVSNASDLGQLLNQSGGSTGIQLQQRNSIVSDPRVRGLRSYQYSLIGDNASFIPVRLDLDTPVTRFDPGTVRDVIVVKGPYAVNYGPGHGVIDVATLDAPRFKTFEAHGRTSLNYQTNGDRWDGLQSAWAGMEDWGFRITYNGLTGSDYDAGNGQQIASSYLSHNVNYALGLDLTRNSSIEFKGQRVTQSNLEFPGLYFDVSNLNTEAYSLRYTLRDQGVFDRLVLDVYYNTSVGQGDTAQDKKQAFVQKLLAVSFNPNAFRTPGMTTGTVNNPLPSIASAAAAAGPANPLNLFRDLSQAEFATSSLGYRVFADWGKSETGRVTLGNDLRVVGLGLQETIQLQQFSGQNLNTGAAINPAQPAFFNQLQSIPTSRSVNPGLYLDGELPFTDRWTFRAGGRADWVSSSTSNRQISGNVNLFGPPSATTPAQFSVNPQQFSADPSRTNTDRDYFLLAGFLQSQYKLTEHLTGTAAFGHSERAPSLTELYASGPFVGLLQQGTSRLIGDPALKSEKLTQFDIGLQADYGWLRGGVTGFYGWLNDYITFDQLAGGPGLTQVVFTNTDLATLAGTEMFAQVDFTTWLTGFGTVTYVQGVDQTHVDNRRAANLSSSRRINPATGQFATDTEPLPQIPPLESRIGLRFHDPRPERKYQVELSARVVTGQNAVASSLNEQATPGFTTFTVRTYWQATSKLLLTAGVENLGNKNYREHLDPISGNTLGVNPLLRPGANFYFGSQLTY